MNIVTWFRGFRVKTRVATGAYVCHLAFQLETMNMISRLRGMNMSISMSLFPEATR